MSGAESMDLKHSMVPPRRNCRTDRWNPAANPDESFRRQMCDRCPSCVQIRNISEYSSERTPLLAGSSMTLLRNSRCCDKVLIYLFVSVLVIGSGIGTYLLIVESEGAIIEEFDYVSRESWGVNNSFLKEIPSLHKPVSKILLVKLTSSCTDGSKHCLNYQEFVDNNKDKLKIFGGEVSYNFYQNKEGKIFEGRGWNFQSDCKRKEGCDDILTIGLIEETNSALPLTQIQKLKAFLDYCIMDFALKECYEILVKNSADRNFEDLAFTLDKMNRKDGTCQYFI